MIYLDNYNKKCKVTQGGIKKFYLFPFVKYNRFQVQNEGMNLTAFPNSYIYEFDCNGNYNQTNDIEGGGYFFTQTINIQLSEVYNILDVHLFLEKDFRIIVETNNNDLIMFGVYNGLTCKVSNSSGQSKNEFNGFNLDFSGKEEKTGLLISDLDGLGLYKFNKEEIFNYDFNFNI